MKSKIYCVSIPTYPGCSSRRWFLEVQTPDGRWHNVGNGESETDARELLARVRLVGNSWTLADMEALRIGPRRSGVPSQSEMYKILKQRSEALQRESNG